jgi:hypothetical protein
LVGMPEYYAHRPGTATVSPSGVHSRV